MIDPDLQKQLQEINTNLIQIRQNAKAGIWRAFFNGMFSALGYVFGLAVVLALIGWILQQVGLWKPIQEQIKNFGNLVQSAEKVLGPNSGQQQDNSGTNKSSSSGGDGTTLVTLPNGQQVRVNISQFNTGQ